MAYVSIKKAADFGQHLGSRITVIDLMVQPMKANQLRLIPCTPQGGYHLIAVRDVHIAIQVTVEEQDWGSDFRSPPQR